MIDYSGIEKSGFHETIYQLKCDNCDPNCAWIPLDKKLKKDNFISNTRPSTSAISAFAITEEMAREFCNYTFL